MAWVDYKKAYDMVPYSWIVECLQLAQVPENVTTVPQRSMVSWQTELTSSGTSLGNVNIRRGIFQGDSLSPLIFVVCMIPLSKVLRKATAWYLLGDVKINLLLIMGDLKIFGKNRTEIHSLISTVKVIRHDIGMEFGVKKCGIAIMKRGKLVESEDINQGNEGSIKAIDLEGYKYLGILEADKIKENEMKEMLAN